MAERAQKELVLLHPQSTDMPRGTADWLNMRTWCSFHHHIRCPGSILPDQPCRDDDTILDLLLGRNQLPDVRCD